MPLAAAAALVASVRARARGGGHHAGHARGLAARPRGARRSRGWSTCSCRRARSLLSSSGTTIRRGQLVELTGAGVKCVVVKLGGDGALVARPGRAARCGCPPRRSGRRIRPGRATVSAAGSRPGSRSARTRPRPRGAGASPRRPRSARPARCGCWTAGRSRATCWPAVRRPPRLVLVGCQRRHPIRTTTVSRRWTARSPPSPTSSPPSSPTPAGTCGSWPGGWPTAVSSTCT